MNQNEERQILEWVYHTAKMECEKIDKILLQRVRRGLLWESTTAEQQLQELLVYQALLSCIVSKVQKRLSKEELCYLQNTGKITISSEMNQRASRLKYQIHENKRAGIYAWELAKDMIAMEEDLIKKITNHWE